MSEWNFANDDGENEELTRTAMNYVEHFPEFLENGRGLMLCGSVGTGKSFAACEIANALLERGYKVKVTSFTRLLNKLQSENDKQGVIDELNSYKLLVIDDFGVERATEYAQEQISNAIDSRAASGLPLIITTNMSASAMRQGATMWEERIYDRLVKMCFPITVDGHSRRRNAAREDYERDKRLLGGDKL
jgi:DNA replication protein DnaC